MKKRILSLDKFDNEKIVDYRLKGYFREDNKKMIGLATERYIYIAFKDPVGYPNCLKGHRERWSWKKYGFYFKTKLPMLDKIKIVKSILNKSNIALLNLFISGKILLKPSR
jgi:hypothetical protein